jgi:transcriptional regulator with XRE-family HTH domain
MTEKQIGNYIRDRRISLKMPKRQLCIKAGMTSRNILDNIESGKGATIANLVRVCNALNLKYDELLKQQKHDTSADTTKND